MLDIFHWGSYLYCPPTLSLTLIQILRYVLRIEYAMGLALDPRNLSGGIGGHGIPSLSFGINAQDHVFGDTEGEQEAIHRRQLLERLASQ